VNPDDEANPLSFPAYHSSCPRCDSPPRDAVNRSCANHRITARRQSAEIASQAARFVASTWN